jgi:hypothetical protein
MKRDSRSSRRVYKRSVIHHFLNSMKHGRMSFIPQRILRGLSPSPIELGIDQPGSVHRTPYLGGKYPPYLAKLSIISTGYL